MDNYCTSWRTAEVLQPDGSWKSVGRYENLKVGDVFRHREPGGELSSEVCRVVEAPVKRPHVENPDGGFCWSVEVDVLDPIVCEAKQ